MSCVHSRTESKAQGGAKGNEEISRQNVREFIQTKDYLKGRGPPRGGGAGKK